MPIMVTMPQLGESVNEGTISKWLKREGDKVHEYEPLLEVSTDKVDTEVPSPVNGVLLKIYAQEGETVERGALLAAIGEAGESLDEADEPVAVGVAQAPAQAQRTTTATTARPQSNGGSSGYTGHVTPVVARMVAEHNLDLSKIIGTGRDGRITKKDVEAYLENPPAAESQSAIVPQKSEPVAAQYITPTQQSAPTPTGIPGELVRLTNMRRAIAQHMVESKLHISPHVTSVFEVDMSAVLAHRHAHKDAFAAQGVNLTLTAYFTTAAITSLQENPYLNAQWTDEGIFLHRNINVGLAVAIPDGLIVPVVKNAQDYSLLGLARAVNDVTNRARNKQLKADDIQGGTFTITNHGVSGSLFATPIINQPQAGILGIGIVEERVKVINHMIAIRPCVYVSLTFDHRIADGATGDAFLTTFKRMLETWA